MAKILFYVSKGGTGKTALTVNVAPWLTTALAQVPNAAQDPDSEAKAAAYKEQRVCVVDADANVNATPKLLPRRVRKDEKGEDIVEPLWPEKTLRHLMLTKGALLTDHVVPADGVPGLSLVAGDIQLEDVSRQLQERVGREMVLSKALKGADQAFDHILFDGGPAHYPHNITANLFMAADYLVIPIKPEPDDVEAVKTTMNYLRAAREDGSDCKLLGVVVNRHDRQLQVHQDEVNNHLVAILANLGLSPEIIFPAVIPMRAAIVRAGQNQTTLYRENPGKAANIFFLDLASQIIERIKGGIHAV